MIKGGRWMDSELGRRGHRLILVVVSAALAVDGDDAVSR